MPFARSAAMAIAFCISGLVLTAQQPVESAWRDGAMQVDVEGVIGRSDIVLGQPNREPLQAMPLGNGRLGVAIWSQNGLTAQLNRADTMPYRYSTGQVLLPGIAALTAAGDYRGRLNLYNGTFEERGGGMSVSCYLQPHSDTLVIDVAGADPTKPQTAILTLWEPRHPHLDVFSSTAQMGILSESWKDDANPGASGEDFGSLSAITAIGRNVSFMADGPRAVKVTVTPNPDGRFHVLVASPHFQGAPKEATRKLIQKALADQDPNAHAAWWHEFWHRADLIKVTSQDGSGEYMENLRALYLFSAAGENGDKYPGSQAGVGDLFSAVGDSHQWDPSAFWHWNLRMQVAANLSAGLPELNAPYFELYRDNLANMESWTREHMKQPSGICIPETMRFNGKGIEFETWNGNTHQVSGWNCDAASVPYYNARTLSTGAEVSLWIWQQYLVTKDKAFLAENLPVMAASARFLLAYEKPGPDGLLHTSPSNAHENQWDVLDPTTDLSARRTLFTATVEAAEILKQDPSLVSQLKQAIPLIPPFPRVSSKAPTVLLSASDDAGKTDIIATSYRPGDTIHNVENIGMEPVWPYNLVGDTSPLFGVAKRTYAARANKGGIDWSYDPVQAARLGLGKDVQDNLLNITQANQRYINGFAKWGGDGKEFYVEQIANVALALQESLVQDYDGIIRIAPAIPPGWDFDGTVTVRDRTKVRVQVRGGRPTSVGLESQTSHPVQVKNPWPGTSAVVKDAASEATVTTVSADGLLSFEAKAGTTYRIDPDPSPRSVSFVTVDGVPAKSFRRLGPVQIGLEPSRSPAH